MSEEIGQKPASSNGLTGQVPNGYMTKREALDLVFDVTSQLIEEIEKLELPCAEEDRRVTERTKRKLQTALKSKQLYLLGALQNR